METSAQSAAGHPAALRPRAWKTRNTLEHRQSQDLHLCAVSRRCSWQAATGIVHGRAAAGVAHGWLQ